MSYIGKKFIEDKNALLFWITITTCFVDNIINVLIYQSTLNANE